ncbi:MAG: SDR family NAD(P)-dependent oxidoreductase [Bacteroidota bacterium]|jgi:short-subunit dehydrogenase
MKIAGKVFLVTGAGSGMGREMAHQIIAKGGKVAGLDIHLPQLLETQKICAATAATFLAVEVDITDRSKVLTLPEQVIKQFGQIDGIINNAGIIQPFVKVNDLTFEQVDRVMNVNFYGCVNVTKAFLPHLLERPEAHIVNISSMGGFLPVPGQSIYGSAKAAVKLFTEGLYAELKETSVRVSVVFPGAIATNITTNSGITMPKNSGGESSGMTAMPANEAARIILHGMETDQYRILVGSDSKFMDFLCRLAPEFATNFIRKKMKALLG